MGGDPSLDATPGSINLIAHPNGMIRTPTFFTLICFLLAVVFISNTRGEVVWSDDFSSGNLNMDYPGGKAGPDYIVSYGTGGSVSANGVIGVSAPSLKLDTGGGTSGSAAAQVTMDQFAPFTVGPLSGTPFLRVSFDLRVEGPRATGHPEVYFLLAEGSAADRSLRIGYSYGSLNDGGSSYPSFADLALYASTGTALNPNDSTAIGLVPGTGWKPGFDFGDIYLVEGAVGAGTKNEFYRITFLYNSITGAVTGRVIRLSTGESAPLPAGLSLTPGTTFSSDDVRDQFRVSAEGRAGTYVDNIVFEALATDALTEPPALAAPAEGTRTGWPVTLSFTLPENALPGSVKLSFGDTILTLAATQEGAGFHSFIFDPADPTAVPQIASATGPVADGTYVVTLSYQDADGNPVAGDTSSGVTIYTVAHANVIWSDNFSSGTLNMDFPGGKAGPDYIAGAGTYGSVSAGGTIGVSAPSMKLDSGGGTSGYAGFRVAMDQFAPFTVGPLSATPFLRVSVDLRIESFSGSGFQQPEVYFVLTEGLVADRSLRIGYTYNRLDDGDDPSEYELALYASTGTALNLTDSTAIGLVPGTGWLPGFDFGRYFTSPGVSIGEGTKHEFYRISFLYNSITGAVTGRVTRLSTGESAPLPSGLSLTPGTTFSSDDARDYFGVSATGMISTVTYVDNIVFEALSLGTFTEPPVLVAPAKDAHPPSPVPVSFSLPKKALPGSVKLSFGETIFTLATALESAGAHSFSFDPANPTASPYILSGSPVPDGVHVVTLSYQDDFGNVGSATNENVAIERGITVPPVLTEPAEGTPASTPMLVSFSLPEKALPGSVKLRFGGAVLTLASAVESAGSHSFSFDPTNPTASPFVASGSPIPDGVYAVTLLYQDASGNPAAGATHENVTIHRGVTLPPLLTRPVDGARAFSPVVVSFSLPEKALRGSVTLSFGGTVLTLAGIMESAGSHSFSFDPADPSFSPQVASATGPVADGTYVVTLSYQDVLGNPVASDTSREWRSMRPRYHRCGTNR